MVGSEDYRPDGLEDSETRGDQPTGAGDDGRVYGECYLTLQVVLDDG